jgi:peptidoglycan/LPS O-acetylase OafA/YrhL
LLEVRCAFFTNLITYIPASGVELFFVLSSVVLLRPYLRKQRKFEFRKYYLRRFQRIFPPYFAAWLVTGIVIGYISLYPTWYSQEILPIFSWSDWLVQLPIISITGISYNAAWWSLGVEIFFYLLAPFLVNLFSANWLKLSHLVSFVLISMGFAILARNLLVQINLPLVSIVLNFVMYLPAFLGGIAIAKFDLPKRLGYFSFGIGLIYLLISSYLPALSPHNGLSLIYIGIVSLSLRNVSYFVNGFSSPLMVWLGERSYSLFLIHFTVFYAVNHLCSLFLPSRNLTYFLLTRLLGLPLALLAAMILFHTVERRFARNLVTANYFFPNWNQPYKI